MSSTKSFRAVIESAGGGGAFVRIPFDVDEVYGKKRVPIRATIGGEEYRGMLVRMGEPFHILGVLKDIRKKIGKDIGDEIEVILEEDTEKRVVVIPDDLMKALERDPRIKAAYERLSYTNQKEIVRSIEAAKKAETRQDRVARAIAQLKEN